jgi:hypothetical protein
MMSLITRVSDSLGRWYHQIDFSKMGRNIQGEIQNIALHTRPPNNNKRANKEIENSLHSYSPLRLTTYCSSKSRPFSFTVPFSCFLGAKPSSVLLLDGILNPMYMKTHMTMYSIRSAMQAKIGAEP